MVKGSRSKLAPTVSSGAAVGTTPRRPSALQAYKDGMVLTELDEKGEKTALTIRTYRKEQHSE